MARTNTPPPVTSSGVGSVGTELPERDNRTADERRIEAGADLGTNSVDLGNSRDATQARLDKLSKDNEEGHRKNMERIEHAHRHNSEDAKPASFLGREDNACTPRIDKDGNKSWHPPGVAGVAAPRDAPAPETELDDKKRDNTDEDDAS
jgi:hypothetical protein